MNQYNFTTSNDWINSYNIRYDIDKLMWIKKICFYEENENLKCLSFFDFDIKEIKEEIIKLLNSNKIFRFNYVDEPLYLKLKKEFSGFKIEIIDKWYAPLLKTKNIEKYLENNKNSQVRKNYKNYKKSNINIETSNNDNILKLWTDVLYIDKNSWKNEEKSDMKSLDREDLQYIFYMLNNKDKISLNVSYNNKIPTSYSLMFKEKNNKWYAVKWGASFLGREKYHGIYCLYDHLIKLSDKQEINIDFWGRRSESYDYLKNNSLKRYHIILKKE